MNVRPATFDDLPWLRQLYAHFVEESAAPYPTVHEADYDAFVLLVAKVLRDDPSVHIVVAEHDGRAVAFLCAAILIRPIGEPRQVVTVHWLYCEPTHRGQGIARALASAALAWVRARWPDVTAIEIPARFGNTRWERWGLTPFLVTLHGTLAAGDAFVTNARAISPAPVAPRRPKSRRKHRRANGHAPSEDVRHG